MADLNLCPRCGGSLPKDAALDGGCPHCMLELGFKTSVGSMERPEKSVATERPAAIGRYRILRLIGEGGMGAVYEAEQDHPCRTVALKIIKSGMASAELLRRFEQESQALGRLQHPGIAQIYEAGTVDTGFGPQPYFAMELIRGQSPREYAETNKLSTRDRLQMMVKICEAVHHAHQRGLIHRDLKPGNILVDETGQPKILDFGVVRVTDSDARATLQTDMGQLIGTLAYMSPEQALADPLDVDTRSDVYSLGVILYELLAGRLPYTVSKKVHEAIQAIREEDPTRLSTSNRTFRGDIETIVAKALEKDRSRRYVSAAEMAADIQRYLNDEPIVARRPSASYQLQKFARRNKSLVTGVAAVFVVLVAGIIVATSLLVRARHAEQGALLERDIANHSKLAETQARARETELRHVAEDLRIQADAQTLTAKQSLRASEVNLYFNNIALADREWLASNTGHVDQLLTEAPAALRNWEWHYLKRLNHMEDTELAGHREAVLAMVMDPQGKQLRTVGADYVVKDWDIKTSNVTATQTLANPPLGQFSGIPLIMALSANGRTLYAKVTSIINGDLSVFHKFWDLSSGKKAFSPSEVYVQQRSFLTSGFILSGFEGSAVAVSPDGIRGMVTFASGRGSAGAPGPSPPTLRSWDIGTGRELSVFSIDEVHLGDLLFFSPNGEMLAFVQNAWTRILDSKSGQELVKLDHSQGDITALAFSDDSATVVAGIQGKGLRDWNTADGRELWSISTGTVTQVTFSPDSRLIAIALSDRTIRILDSSTGREGARLTGHTGTIHVLSFNLDGSQLVSAGDDKVIRIWNLRTRIPERTLDVGLLDSYVQVSSDDRSTLTSTGYGLKLWDLSAGLLRFDFPSYDPGRQVAFSEDGSRILAVVTRTDNFKLLERPYLQILDARTGREIALLQPPKEGSPGYSAGLPSFQISPDGSRAALVIWKGTLMQPSPQKEAYVWDVSTESLIARFDFNNTLFDSFKFSPDGKLAAVFTGSVVKGGVNIPAGIDIFDTTTGRHLNKLDCNGRTEGKFSPDGNRLLVVEGGRSMAILDVRTGLRLVSFPEAGNTGTTVMGTDFSPDGTRLVSVSSDGEVWLWDNGSGKALIQLRESSGPYEVREVTVIAERHGSLSVTSVTKQFSIAFSPDGRKITLTTVSQDPKGAKVRIETWDGSPRQK